MFDNLDILTLVLIAGVILAVVLSFTSLIIQITKVRSLKRKIDSAQKVNNHPYSAVHNLNPVLQQIPIEAPTVKTHEPYQPYGADDNRDETVSIFPNNPQHQGVAEHSNQPQSHVYRMSIKVTLPEGSYNYDIFVGGEFSVGRLNSRDLYINNTTVSSLQCVFVSGQNGVYVKNCSNSNITLLNGAKLIDMRLLKSGDMLHLGKVQIVIMNIGQ